MNQTITKAVTEQHAANSFVVPDGMMTGGSITGVVIATIVAVLGFRKRLSRDNLELVKDRAETNLIKTYQDTIKALQDQNTRLDENAREAWRVRADDAKRIGELSSKVEHLGEVNESLDKNVAALRTQIRDLVNLLRQVAPHDTRLNSILDNGSLQHSTPTQEHQNGN